MVFSGRPSTACLACRQRRLKCDRDPAGCAQCRRKGIRCADYRDPNALRLRDETVRFRPNPGKAERPTSPGRPSATAAIAAPEAEASAEASLAVAAVINPLGGSLPLQVARHLHGHVADAAMAFFTTSYIRATPFQRYVPALCSDRGAAGDACAMAISAAALATYSRHSRSPQLLQGARQQYAKALIQVNQLLQRPDKAILDRTLGAVLALGHFEAAVFEGGKSPTGFTAHTLGALQLLRMRGPLQAGNEVASEMYKHVSSKVKTCCIQRNVPVPPDLRVLDAAVPDDNGGAFAKMGSFLCKVSSIRARTLDGPSVALVREALLLDQDIVAYFLKFRVKPRQNSDPCTDRGVCLKYSNLWVVKLENAARLLRLFLITIIHNAATGKWGFLPSNLPDADEESHRRALLSRLREYARKNMVMVTTDIFATIPVFLERNGLETRFTPAGRSLAWSLTLIEENPLTCPHAREYAIKHLQKLASDLNMPQILHSARRQRVLSNNDWFHLFHME